MRFDAAIFDYDGVLVELDRSRAAALFHGRSPLPVRALHQRWEAFCADHHEARLIASEMWCAFWAGLGPELRIPAAALAEICAYDYLTLFRRYPDALDAFREARRLGLRIGVLSNSALPRFESPSAPLPVTELADVVRVPARGSAVKPESAAYLDVARLLGTSPDRCLYFDDEPSFVAAARATGMHGFLVRRSGGAPLDDPAVVKDLSDLRALARG
jgi:FMN phosphatase YigB (HAD superfamily)